MKRVELYEKTIGAKLDRRSGHFYIDEYNIGSMEEISRAAVDFRRATSGETNARKLYGVDSSADSEHLASNEGVAGSNPARRSKGH